MVTFETKCYENDWEFILKGRYLQQMIANCRYEFTKKIVYINNVNDLPKVRHYAEKKIKKGIIDAYYVVDDYAKEALNFFNIDPASFQGGYHYSIAELVAIYLCDTDYLLHFSSDTMPQPGRSPWIRDAIEIFKEREDVIVANPTWDFNYIQAAEESFDSIRNFYLGYGFSDQCYLIKKDVFRSQIYHENHPLSERYPKYGGELFEKRVDSYMRNHSLSRISSKEAGYLHKNFEKDKMHRFKRKWNIYFKGTNAP